ncbi:MAG TPA: cytochrome c biogenesis protein DipZ [Terriglobia bacterium]|nr:cytochrome c biogenesis protein DipZ [Terriglobia bacterium]
MTFLVLSYLAGIFTIASPCILPILPFVLAGTGKSFRRDSLPTLLGLAFAFAGVASLAAFAGGWAVEVNHHARNVILALLAMFGLTLLFPALADRLLRPAASAGARLAHWATEQRDAGGPRPTRSLLLGMATGLIWAPCAGPVLGLVLSGAALNGPSLQTGLLLLAYGLGAATSLGAVILLGQRFLGFMKMPARWSDLFRRVAGATVVLSAGAIWFGADTGLLTRLSADLTARIERNLISATRMSAFGTTAQAATPALPRTLRALLEGSAPLNTLPLRAEDLQGKVVVVNFWTYSCINCLRNLPYVRAWAEKYKDQGLVVIGVHTPEFAFEKDPANVRQAIETLGITYPVVPDNDFGIWQAFGNEAWPALYFVDADGRLRDQRFGEGDYDTSEELIQKLLTEAKGAKVEPAIAAVKAPGTQAAPDERDLYSGETYIGYEKATHFAARGGTPDVPSHYQMPADLALNWWGLSGDWTLGGEFATLNAVPGRIAYRFHARDLHLVMGPAQPGQEIRFRVTIDGAAPGVNHGTDTDADGWGTAREVKLYQLVRQAEPVGEHRFEIEFLAPGIRAYAFTFG